MTLNYGRAGCVLSCLYCLLAFVNGFVIATVMTFVDNNVNEYWCFEWLGQMLLSMILETLPSRHYFFRNDFNTEILRNFDLGSRFWKLMNGE